MLLLYIVNLERSVVQFRGNLAILTTIVGSLHDLTTLFAAHPPKRARRKRRGTQLPSLVFLLSLTSVMLNALLQWLRKTRRPRFEVALFQPRSGDRRFSESRPLAAKRRQRMDHASCCRRYAANAYGIAYFPWAYAHGYMLPSLRDC